MDRITFFRSYYDAISALEPEMQLEVYNAVFRYALDGEAPSLSGAAKAIFLLMKPNIDKSNNNQTRNVENGSKGGRPKTQPEPNQNPNETQPEPKREDAKPEEKADKDKEKDKEKGIWNKESKGARKTRFSPPTVKEVSDYCRERGNRVDPQRFVDFYASKGWMVGKAPMRDWAAAVRTWEQRDDQPAKPAKGQPSYSPPSNDIIAKFMGG